MSNRLTEITDDASNTYAYATGTNLLTSVTGTATTDYTYDANGNITGIGDKVLTYNDDNRLVSVVSGSTTLGTYTYNGLGQRVKKVAGSTTTIFLYDFDGNIIGESNASGTFSKEYLYRGSSRLAMVDVGAIKVYYYGNDQLGTPEILTDSTNTVVWEAIYKPFGEAEVNEHSTVVNNFRFPGQYYDQETGFHYNYYRYYDPSTGRYLTPDPIGLDGGINLFAYVAGNPVNKIDSLGLWFDGLNVANNLAKKVDRNVLQSSSQCENGKKKSCWDRYWEEFERNRVFGASMFGLPTSFISGSLTTLLTAGPGLAEKIAQNAATGAFESQRLTSSSIYVKNYFPRFFSWGTAARFAGKASLVVTVGYLSADVTTLIYTWITFDCKE